MCRERKIHSCLDRLRHSYNRHGVGCVIVIICDRLNVSIAVEVNI